MLHAHLTHEVHIYQTSSFAIDFQEEQPSITEAILKITITIGLCVWDVHEANNVGCPNNGIEIKSIISLTTI